MNLSLSRPAALLAVLLTAAGCAQTTGPRPATAMLDHKQAKSIVSDFLGGWRDLKILSLTKFPSGPGYEIKEVDGPGYFVVDVARREVSYAAFETITDKRSGQKIKFDNAVSLARKWASRRSVFKDFRLLKTETGYDWPKPGYATVVWRGAPPKRSRRDFGKVTIDLATGKVAAFGVGNPKWTMFCLPPGVAGRVK